jgi:phosphatidylserine/phosphatidylglycerophosphate/cardiolipin synthase-like enzyme
MGKRTLERRLAKTGTRLKGLRGDLAVVEEQLLHLSDDAEDQTIRAMVAETGSSSFDARSAQGNFENMSKHRSRMIAEIAELEQKQDELLDQMLSAK